MAATGGQEERDGWDEKLQCVIDLWGEGLMVMTMIKTEGAVPANNGGHALDSVPNIQSKYHHNESLKKLYLSCLGKLLFRERLCIKEWDRGHEPTGTTKVGALVTIS